MEISSSSPLEKLKSVFGYTEFRPGQAEIIEHTMSGGDSLVLMPTGGGKSLCYQLPSLLMDGTCVVVSPLISLMQDQVEQVSELGIQAAYLNSSQAPEVQQQTLERLADGTLDLLYVSPEKLLQPSFIRRLQTTKICLFAIDEAHCVSQWGHDFRADYRELYKLKQSFEDVAVMGLTATADSTTQTDIQDQLQLSDPMVYRGSYDRPNIHYRVVQKYHPVKQITDYLSQQDGSGIIYCNSRAKVDELADKLQRAGFLCAAYHAGLDNETRRNVQRQFLTDKIAIVVATVAFGMGINKSNVRFVVHHDVPRSIENYYQETGRAGRDGLASEAMMLFDEKDVARIKLWIEQGESENQVKLNLQKFEAMASFAEALICRRLVLLNYFSEYTEKSCGNCDVCIDPPKMINGLTLAQKVLSCVLRLEQKVGMQYLIDILRGKQHKKLNAAHLTLSTHGIGKDKSDAYWLSIINQLIHKGLLRISHFPSGTLKLTAAAAPVLRSERDLQLATPRLGITGRNAQKNSQNYDKALFARLKNLRKVLAEENDVPPFVIFSDASLIDMAEKLPVDSITFLAVSGVGNTKLERYGDAFITLINDYLQRSHDVA